MSRPWKLTNNYTNQSFSELYLAVEVTNCSDLNFTEYLFKVGLRMLFSSLNGKKYNTINAKRKLIDSLCDLAEENHGITAIDMILIGAFGGELYREVANEKSSAFLGTIQEISGAIRQVLENIVNHSANAKGVFSLRLQENQTYLKQKYPQFMSQKNNGCVELLIADSNTRDTITTNFLSSTKADVSLINHADSICLSNFFGVFQNDDIKKLWQSARQKRPTTCFGLLTFASAINQIKGTIKVRSSTLTSEKDDRNFFSNTESIFETEKKDGVFYIPGTQFSVAIDHPLELLSNDYVQEEKSFSFENIIYSTTYNELAELLLCDSPKSIEITNELIDESINAIESQEKKDAAAIKWQQWFDNILRDDKEQTSYPMYVFYACDVNRLCQSLESSPRIAEPFCKGLFSSKFFLEENSRKKYGVIFHNVTEKLGYMINSVLSAVKDEIKTNSTELYLYPRRYGKRGLPYNAMTLTALLRRFGKDKTSAIHPIFPYALLLQGKEGRSQFENDILEFASIPITEADHQGYKIENTHMRLGNKVHLDAFYEMALFFGNSNYAYYTAFLLLKELIRDPAFIMKKRILLYGYASYSSAIIWSTIQIFKMYCLKKGIKDGPEIEFVLYQNDLKRDSDDSQVQMYFSKGTCDSALEWINEDEQPTLIMIVPISSSLTTFKKMLIELKRYLNNSASELKKENRQDTHLQFGEILNYTAFWVRDDYRKKNRQKARDNGLDDSDDSNLECFPTDEEEKFWKNIKPQERIVEIKDGAEIVHYLLHVRSNWEDPLTCEKCYPPNPLMEYPLVETDPTSTVPTQQFYLHKKNSVIENADDRDNEMRLARLKGHVLYGHISRGDEHYQYYVKTRDYFQQEKDEVKGWIKGIAKPAPPEDGSRTIDILVVPRHTSNVEFSQFIYEYYFGAVAYCMSIDPEKEYRSNFMAENNGLLNQLLENKDHSVIRFYYADTSIRSGTSFNRIVSLLSSFTEGSGMLKKFRFEKVFLLISRLSEASKCAFVDSPADNFHAYLQINISSLRTFGDSCVPCKHQQDAQHFFENAATKKISAYWEEKSYHRGCVPFDKAETIIKPELNDEGYRRLICAHRLACLVKPIRGDSEKDYFQAIQKLFDEILAAARTPIVAGSDKQKAEELSSWAFGTIDACELKLWLSAGFKVLVRPFFSFDYKLRCAAMDILLLISEYYINSESEVTITKRIEKEFKTNKKSYLLENDSLKWITDFLRRICIAVGEDEFEQFEFYRDNILKGLADIRSNYLFRKDTLIKIGNKLSQAVENRESPEVFAQDFFEHYMRSIMRLTHGSSDETKSLWLEHLLQQGEEYNKTQRPIQPKDTGIDILRNEVPTIVQSSFQHFLEILLIENNRPLYQRVKQSVDFSNKEGNNKNGQVEYYERNADQFLKYEYAEQKQREDCISELKKLYIFLSRPSCENGAAMQDQRQPGMINEDYEKLRNLLKCISSVDNDQNEEVLLIGKRGNQQLTRLEVRLGLSDYYAISPKGRGLSTQESIRIVEERIADETNLKQDGFSLIENEDGSFNVVLLLDNNYDELIKCEAVEIDSGMQKISPIYVYIPCALTRHSALMLIRKILMFRRKLISLIERDFNNNAVAAMIQQQQLTRILAQDKVGDHAANDFVDSLQRLLTAEPEEEYVKEYKNKIWDAAVGENGTCNPLAYESYSRHAVLYSDENQCDYTEAAKEWFLMRAYINSRISRMFRTLARSESITLTDAEGNANYALRSKRNFMYPAISLADVFFSPIQPGHIRKNYIRTIMETHCFVINGHPDYEIKANDRDTETWIIQEDATIEERMESLRERLKSFVCVCIEKDNRSYAYLSEYLAIILLDCFISALKANEIWIKDDWSAEVFCRLKSLPAAKKCIVRIDRREGTEKWDYLVVSNSVRNRKLDNENNRERLGMSQKAVCDYIEGLWSYTGENINGLSAFEAKKINGGTEYETKMLVLQKGNTEK